MRDEHPDVVHQLVDVAKCATSNLNGGVPVDLVCEVDQ